SRRGVQRNVETGLVRLPAQAAWAPPRVHMRLPQRHAKVRNGRSLAKFPKVCARQAESARPSRSGLILCAERGLVSGRSIGHAEVDFMSLSNSQRSRCDRSLERAFLGCISVVDASVVQHTPFITL